MDPNMITLPLLKDQHVGRLVRGGEIVGFAYKGTRYTPAALGLVLYREDVISEVEEGLFRSPKLLGSVWLPEEVVQEVAVYTDSDIFDHERESFIPITHPMFGSRELLVKINLNHRDFGETDDEGQQVLGSMLRDIADRIEMGHTTFAVSDSRDQMSIGYVSVNLV